MDTIFTLGDGDDESTKINLDDLYEKKKQSDLHTLRIYNKILQRIHGKIKTHSRINKNEQYCWYLIPEMMIGVPRYDVAACTAYLIDKLRHNGFVIRYTHPNLLFISWANYTPGYVREEIRKKTGIQVDGWGNKKQPKTEDNDNNSNNNDPNSLLIGAKKNISVTKSSSTQFRNIDAYKPTGNLIYNNELLKHIENRGSKT